jgi:hypothetical protein
LIIFEFLRRETRVRPRPDIRRKIIVEIKKTKKLEITKKTKF